MVRSFNVAVSDHGGIGALALRAEIGSKHHIVTENQEAGDTVPVPLVALDEFVEDGRFDAATVGLFWLDIEGLELEALQGAQTLVGRSTPIVMEFDPRVLDGARLEAFRSLLGQHYTGVVDLRTERPSEPEILPFSPSSRWRSVTQTSPRTSWSSRGAARRPL